MAAWRRAIELSLGDSDVEKLRLIAQSRTELPSRSDGARLAWAGCDGLGLVFERAPNVDRRDCRTSSMSPSRAEALMSASVTGFGSAATDLTSTATNILVSSVGSG